jgi:2-oxoglutarate dehydrogenase E2 component (dihydrolipoamide succinyltransferase)
MLVDVCMPQLGESVSEGTVTRWHVRAGDVIEKDAPLVEIATDKADSELPAPSGGRVVEILAPEGEVVAVRAVLCRIDEGVSTPLAADAEPPAGAARAPFASPATRRQALEQGVRLVDVSGSGAHGRITREDVLRAAGKGEAPAAATPALLAAAEAAAPSRVAQATVTAGGHATPVPGVGYGSFKVPAYRPAEGDRVVPFTRRRRITADHMTYSKVVSPHVMTVAEVDLHETTRLRAANKDRYAKEGHPLTMLAFVAVATARALRENPQLNARILDDALVLLGDIHLGVAMESPDGLVVPVLRRADTLGIRGVARGIDELAKRARTGKITIDELSSASFSISNPGVKGNLYGGAVINQPNAGILRMGEIQKRVVVVDGPEGDDAIAIHPVMYMALSYDHRIVDGVAANAFLWRVTEILEKGEFEV